MEAKAYSRFIKVFFAILFFLSANSGSAQVQIVSNDLMGLLGTFQTLDVDKTGSFSIDLGAAGANQVWDFTFAMPQAVQTRREFAAPAGTPFAADFPAATWAIVNKDTAVQPFAREIDTWDYFGISGSGFSQLGGGNVTFAPDSAFLFYRAIQATATLPLNSNSTWTGKLIAFTGDTTAFGTAIDVTANSVVDAWGTVRLPIGDFDCLRIRNENVELFRQFSFGNVASVDTVTRIKYFWISKDNYIVAQAESRDKETDPNFTVAKKFTRIASRAIVTGVDAPDATIPVRFKLFQNYPNPFNPSTAISYQLSAASEVVLEIYSISGQQIKTLVSGKQAAGSHSVLWDGTDESGLRVASGVYLLTMRAGEFVQARKLTLMK